MKYLLIIVAGGLAAQDRLPPIPADKQTAAQKKAIIDYKDLRKTDLTGPPWTVLLRVPDLIVPSLQLRLHNQTTNNPLGPKLTEFAILIAAREWTNNFEWNAHSNLATTAGLSAAIIAAVADGRRPERMAEDEELLWDFCNELLHNKVSAIRRMRAAGEIRRRGSSGGSQPEGYYHYLSMVMNPPVASAGRREAALALFPK
jgi:4-carboxymuconolactone decarboxylase